MSILELALSKHNEWIAMAKSLGCGDFSEDIVQEMYLRIHKYANAPDRIMYNDEINKSFIYVTIRNLSRDLHKAKEKSRQIILKDVNLESIDIADEEFDDTLDQLNEVVKGNMCSWNPYDKILFSYVYSEGISMRKLSRETGISLRSIFNTIQNAKESIKEAAKKEGIEGIRRCN